MLYTYPPGEATLYPRCMFKAATGYDCPGCGSTRAAHALLHGRFREAFRFNPMLFAMGGVILCALPSLARGNQPQFMTKPWFSWSALVVVVGWWIVRNLAW